MEEAPHSETVRRRSSMMTTMTNRMRRLSEISIELARDQSLWGLGILLVSGVLFIMFIYYFNWFGVYIILFELFKTK